MKRRIDIKVSNEIPAEVYRRNGGRLSKQDDIDICKGLVEALPDGYLRDTLRHICLQFEQDVRSDFPTIPDLRAIQLDVLTRQQELADVRCEVHELKKERDAVRSELETLTSRLRGQMSTAMSWAKDLRDSAIRTEARLK